MESFFELHFIEIDSLIKYEANVKKPPFLNSCSFLLTPRKNESFEVFLCKAIKPTERKVWLG